MNDVLLSHQLIAYYHKTGNFLCFYYSIVTRIMMTPRENLFCVLECEPIIQVQLKLRQIFHKYPPQHK